jgi:hypothetical protein
MDTVMNHPGTSADSGATPDTVLVRIAERLSFHLEPLAVEGVCAALARGQVVRLGAPEAGGLVAFKRGVLFIAGYEYVIGDE